MDRNTVESLETHRTGNPTEVANQVLGTHQFDVEKAVKDYFQNEGVARTFSEVTGGLLEF